MIPAILTFIGLSLTIILPWMILCATKRKVEPNNGGATNGGGGPPKIGEYKPGHLPEFADPDQKETNTFYDVQSVIAFPVKDNENGNGSKPSSTPNIQTPSTNVEKAATTPAAAAAKTPTNIK